MPPYPRPVRTRRAIRAVPLAIALVITACGSSPTNSASNQPTPATTAPSTDQSMPGHDDMSKSTLSRADRVSAQLATAAFQDVSQAEAVGYASTLQTLGCFQNPQHGGMGVHYLNSALMDDKLDLAHPEALVYELDARGNISGLVAHEYIVPIDAWTKPNPPTLLGIPLHRHPSLPLWVLHIWLWKDNPAGIFEDWNPAVRQCPTGVPIFGVDRPLPPDSAPSTTVPTGIISTNRVDPPGRTGPR